MPQWYEVPICTDYFILICKTRCLAGPHAYAFWLLKFYPIGKIYSILYVSVVILSREFGESVCLQYMSRGYVAACGVPGPEAVFPISTVWDRLLDILATYVCQQSESNGSTAGPRSIMLLGSCAVWSTFAQAQPNWYHDATWLTQPGTITASGFLVACNFTRWKPTENWISDVCIDCGSFDSGGRLTRSIVYVRILIRRCALMLGDRCPGQQDNTLYAGCY